MHTPGTGCAIPNLTEITLVSRSFSVQIFPIFQQKNINMSHYKTENIDHGNLKPVDMEIKKMY